MEQSVNHSRKALGCVDHLVLLVRISLDGAAKRRGTHAKKLSGDGTKEQVDIGEQLTYGSVGASDGELGRYRCESYLPHQQRMLMRCHPPCCLGWY